MRLQQLIDRQLNLHGKTALLRTVFRGDYPDGTVVRVRIVPETDPLFDYRVNDAPWRYAGSGYDLKRKLRALGLPVMRGRWSIEGSDHERPIPPP